VLSRGSWSVCRVAKISRWSRAHRCAGGSGGRRDRPSLLQRCRATRPKGHSRPSLHEPQAYLRLAHRACHCGGSACYHGRFGAGGCLNGHRQRAPLAALVAYKLNLPSVFVRSDPKEYFLSYGGDPDTNDSRLSSGERLPDGTVVHVIDDFVHSGATLAQAVEPLRGVRLRVESAAAFLTILVTTG
jgi:hypothetical protein